MKRILCIVVVAIGICLVGSLQIQETSTEGSSYSRGEVSIAVTAAHAGPVRRTARRTARRVARRSYYYSLPRGCVRRVVGGVRYSYCGGLYYHATTDNAGKTAYIIVNP